MYFYSGKRDKLYMASDRRLWFTHKCRFCNYFFVSEKDLVHHEATHDAPNFACDSCSSVFDDAEQLSVHVNNGCSTADSSTDIGRQHVCGACGEIFRFVRELYKHYSEHHMSDKSSLARRRKPDDIDDASMCANCGAIFSGAASLKVHLWKAHNLNFGQQPDNILGIVTCRDSDATSTCRRLLVTDNDKPFKCSMCNWSFKYDFSFHAHMKMHEQKQRVLEEMLRANSDSQPSVADDVALVDVEPDNTVSAASEVGVPIMLLPLKRKLENSNDTDCLPAAKLSTVCDTNSGRSNCCSTTNLNLDANGTRRLSSEAASDQHPVDNTSRKSVSVTRVSSELLRPSPNLRSVVMRAGNSEIKQSASVDRSPSLSDEPFRFACKLCSFKCRYDFSYVAHLNQHDKLKELKIDDLQSHLVASSPQTPPSSHIANKFAIKVISTSTGDVSYVNGHSQVVDSSGISYILLCPGTVDQTALVASLPKDQQYEEAVVTHPTDAIDCLNSNVVLVDDVNTNIEQDLDSAARPATDDDDVDFSVGPEMQFLDLTSGETLYVINESDLQVALPSDVTSEHQRNILCEETETEVVLSPQPNDKQLLDVASLCSDEDGQSDGSESASSEDSFTCYYCNAVFTNKSHLQRHILQLHVE